MPRQVVPTKEPIGKAVSPKKETILVSKPTSMRSNSKKAKATTAILSI